MNGCEYSVGDTLTNVAENLEQADFVKYAGSSGDVNPIHYGEPYAKEIGYDAVFGQGMFTTGVASRIVWEALGLPCSVNTGRGMSPRSGRVTRLRPRLSS